jgi:hypothetical protein
MIKQWTCLEHRSPGWPNGLGRRQLAAADAMCKFAPKEGPDGPGADRCPHVMVGAASSDAIQTQGDDRLESVARGNGQLSNQVLRANSQVRPVRIRHRLLHSRSRQIVFVKFSLTGRKTSVVSAVVDLSPLGIPDDVTDGQTGCSGRCPSMGQRGSPEVRPGIPGGLWRARCGMGCTAADASAESEVRNAAPGSG